tara:strand:+ start:14744 stop:16162 length:1419 start_codon:yes stop_codon:yes gene_type:complete
MHTFVVHNLLKINLEEVIEKIFQFNKNSKIIYFDKYDLKNDKLLTFYLDKYKNQIDIIYSDNSHSIEFVRGYVERFLETEYYSFIQNKSDIDSLKTLKNDLKILNSNKFFRHNKLTSTNKFEKNDYLISVSIHNYNYGRYLDECLSSVFNQTYQNFEIIFSDNCSDDRSWSIAKKYKKLYPDKITIIRNRKNQGPSFNVQNCYPFIRGDFYMELCSDDFLHKNLFKKTVDNFKKNDDLAFVMFHRAIVDTKGNITKEKPFYKSSYLIDGTEQASVYMMAAINPSTSQIIYDYRKLISFGLPNIPLNRWYARRIIDFMLCENFVKIAYLHKPYLFHREHDQSDSYVTSLTLLEILGIYVLNHYFEDYTSSHKVKSRLKESVKKLSDLSLRYSYYALNEGKEEISKKYLYLAQALDLEIQNNKNFLKLSSYWQVKSLKEKKLIFDALNKKKNFATREVSYDPPENSIPIPKRNH